MITMNDAALTVYPNRQQMLDLIRARAASDTEHSGDQAQERPSAASLSPDPTCIPIFY
jgi:hypothetical protein